jgi:hypothetical protein
MTVKLKSIGHWDGVATGRATFDNDTSWPIPGDPAESPTPAEWQSLGCAYLHLIAVESYHLDRDAIAELMRVRRAIRSERKSRKVQP